MGIDGLNPYSCLGKWEHKQQNQRDSSFVGNWAYRDLLWSLRLGTGEAVDRYLGGAKAAFRSSEASHLADFGFEDKPVASTMTYGSLFKLNDDSVAWKDLSWKAYKEKVWQNTFAFQKSVQPNKLVHFFDGVSVRSFAKDVLWEGNIRPFKELTGDTPRVNMGANLAYVGGFGLLGWGVLSATRKAYQQTHQQEDGTWQSRCHTWAEAAKAFASQTVKSLAS